jgi:hypothetical protein
MNKQLNGEISEERPPKNLEAGSTKFELFDSKKIYKE